MADLFLHAQKTPFFILDGFRQLRADLLLSQHHSGTPGCNANSRCMWVLHTTTLTVFPSTKENDGTYVWVANNTSVFLSKDAANPAIV